MKKGIISKICFVLNVLLIVGFCIGTYYMFLSDNSGVALATNGLKNLKYYTVLSNELCGVVAIVTFVKAVSGKGEVNLLWKLIAASVVGLTFIIVLCFLGPLYPDLDMYARGNLWFHLLCPVFAMIEFVLLSLDKEISAGRIPFKWTLMAAVPTLLYGAVYLGNNLINGIGEWPDTNDFYGFLNWGLPMGIVIFAVCVVLTWAIAALLRLPNRIVRK